MQSRILKQSPIALIVNSYDFYCEQIYSEFKLIKRTAFSLNKQIRQTYLDRKEAQNKPVIAIGKPVNGGAVRGRLVLNQGSIGTFDGPLIYLAETNVPPKIIMQENNVAGYISKEGGITSHAALVAIAEKKPCMTDVNWERGEHPDDIILGGFHLKEGDFITLDANTGNIYREEIPIIESGVIDAEFARIKDAIVAVLDTVIREDVDG
ncbi:MAG: PEP-utilizing enzyme [Proteobacteria bacterium]|nr:PEP-utilizing enzyme [Pseudomonadota bacterium]